MASFVPGLDHLGVEEGLWCHEPGLRLTPHLPTTPGPIHDAHNLEQRRRVGLPPIGETQGKLPGTRDDLRDQRGCRVLGPRSEVDPQEEPAPHG
jgi:hypothetical protein